MNQQQQNHCLRRNKVGHEPSSTSLLLFFSSGSNVCDDTLCVGSSGHSLLAYAIIQNAHELVRKVGLSLHLHIFLGHVISLATADNRCNQFGPRSGSTEKS